MATVHLTHRTSVADELAQIHQRIADRAYALFQGRGGMPSDAWNDWLSAEREIVWKPAVEVREQDGTVTVLAALPGVDAKDIHVDVTPQEMIVKAATEHTHNAEKGEVYCCEFVSGEAFRAIGLPKPVDVAKARADYQNGMLRVTAPIAPEARSRRIDVSAA